MELVEMPEAEKLVRSIRHLSNRCAASDALDLRDKWLLENDLGLLHMATGVRALLENALASSDGNS